MAVIGIDSHKDVLAGCAVDEAGRPVARRGFDNTPQGHAEVIAWAVGCGAGRVAIEGSGNYGRPLAEAVAAAGLEAVEVPPQMTAHARRGQRTGAKSDETDALLIARIGARDRDLPPPRPGGAVEDLRCVVRYRRELVKARNQHINRLHGDLEQIRCGYRRKMPAALGSARALETIRRQLRNDPAARAGIARRRINAIAETNRQINDLAAEIAAAVAASGSALTEIYSAGALVAANILAEVGDPARFATKAKFAMANGTAPIEASSGRIVRHRLNRGGNRQLNKAIHTIATTQISRPGTEVRRYYQRCLDNGKTKREAIRALKRRISDRIWTNLQTNPPTYNLT